MKRLVSCALLSFLSLAGPAASPAQPLPPASLLALDALGAAREHPAVPAGRLFSVSRDLGTPTLVHGEPDFQVSLGLAVDAQGRVLFTNDNDLGGTAEVARWDPATGLRDSLCAGGALTSPFGVTVGADGAPVVANPFAVFGPSPVAGNVLRCDEASGQASVLSEGQLLQKPAGVALEPEGTLLVTDPGDGAGQGRIVRVDPTGPAVANQTSVASGAPLVDPVGIAVDPACGVYVADFDGPGGSGRILSLDRDTNDLETVCSGAPLVDPLGLAIDADCTVLVANADVAGLLAALELPPAEILPALLLLQNSIVRCDPTSGELTPVSTSGAYVFTTGVAVVPAPEPGASAAAGAALGALAALSAARRARTPRRASRSRP